MNKSTKNKSPRSIIFDCILTVANLFDSFQNEMDKINSGKLFGDKYTNLMNDTISTIEDNLLKISLLIKYKTEIKFKPKKIRKPIEAVKVSYNMECTICKENRAIETCHIIPRSEGGINELENLIFLCPTHHFLFDHSRLYEDEFNEIDLSGKSNLTKEYFKKIHKSKHKMRWKYYTNRFEGCDCGSFDFIFEPYKEGYSVKVCLKCTGCGETWLNLWEDNNPITKAEIIVYDCSEYISDDLLNNKLKDAEEKIWLFIKKEIPLMKKR